MDTLKQFDSLQIIELLPMATLTNKILWTRISDYAFYNARNKALMNYVDLFSAAPTPKAVSDPVSADITKSYYAEFSGVAFCLMRCSQVIEDRLPARDFFNFMIQKTPYSNFEYRSLPEDKYQLPLQALVPLIENQISKSIYDPTPLSIAMEKLRSEVVDFREPIAEVKSVHADSSSYKHSCVVNAGGYYVEFVLVLFGRMPDGTITENVQYYTLKDGEYLVDALPPTSYVKARWNGTNWEEAATHEEIAEAEKKKI